MEEHLFYYKAQVVRVIDGDTVEFLVDQGLDDFTKIRLRIDGVDTSETKGVKKESEEFKLGKLATEFTTEWLNLTNNVVYIRTHKSSKRKKTFMESKEKKTFDRYVADVWASEGPHKGDSLAEALIKAGHQKQQT